VAGGEGYGLIKEKQLGPSTRLRDRAFAAPELQQAGDPRLGRPLAGHHGAVAVHKDAAVAGEGAPCGDGVDRPIGEDAITLGQLRLKSGMSLTFP